MDKEIYNQMCGIAGSDNVSIDEPMNNHITFRVGGTADYYVTPHSIEEVRQTILLLKENNMPYYILGNGSNVLIGDNGYRGVIIKIYKNLSNIQIDGTVITAQAGALLSKVASQAANNNLTGFEFAAGIPGTIGGATVMNAGAYGGEMKDIIVSSKVLDKDGNIIELSNEELELGYRKSIISKKEYIVFETKINLEAGNEDEIKSRMKELRDKRVEKQPLEYASAGSTFKRPEGYYAGKLIMDAGLRGYSVGGAQVSEKHCGFIINRDNATAKDIRDLIKKVQDEVFKQFSVQLETEVKMLGEF